MVLVVDTMITYVNAQRGLDMARADSREEV